MDWHECVEHHANMFKIIVRIIEINNIVWWCNHKNEIHVDKKNVEMLQNDVIKNVCDTKRMRATFKNNPQKRKKNLQNDKYSVRKKFCK